ncbi:MAG: fatty acid desaturase [Granulosicoccus sp.]|nr:fatty acid desaturase [Granulosicoccus sp.]
MQANTSNLTKKPEVTLTPMSAALSENNPVISRRELKALMKRSNLPGLKHLALWLCLLAATSTLVWLSLDSVWLLLPALFLHGVVMVHHFALQHECSHYTAFRSRWLCNALAAICGFLLFIPPRFFRYEHCDHHTFTNIAGKDPELIELPQRRWQYLLYLSAIPYWYGQFGGIMRRAAGRINDSEKKFLPATELSAVVLESRLMVLGYLIVASWSIAADSLVAMIFWWLPLLFGEPVMRFIRMAEHVGRPMIADRHVNTRTSLVSRLWRFLAWNMNFHAEHHYAASVPFHALEKLHERLRDSVYVEEGGYWQAHVDIRQRMSVKKA